jgi:putative redox protein
MGGTDRIANKKASEPLREAVARSVPKQARQEVEIGPHRLTVDLPANQGGEDCGARPRELLAVALAACISMTVTGYARRKEWLLTETIVKVCLNEEDRKDVFRADLGLDGQLSMDQRQRLASVASQCAVGKLLAIDVHVVLTEGLENKGVVK